MTLKTLATLQTTPNKKASPGHIQGVANSLTITRDGTLVTQAAGEKVVGKTVPLLLSHDWNALPIGSVTMEGVDDDGLHYDGKLFDSAPDREQILEGVNSGVLAVSVGFLIDGMDKEGGITDIDLLELSITPVPADAKATVTQELKIESEEQDNMNEDKKKKQAEDPTTDDPTLQDVLDAIATLSENVDKILKAVSPDEGDQDNGDPAPKPEKVDQGIDNLESFMLHLPKDMTLNALDRSIIRESVERFNKTKQEKENK